MGSGEGGREGEIWGRGSDEGGRVMGSGEGGREGEIWGRGSDEGGRVMGSDEGWGEEGGGVMREG
jgi:hypothetical protein